MNDLDLDKGGKRNYRDGMFGEKETASDSERYTSDREQGTSDSEQAVSDREPEASSSEREASDLEQEASDSEGEIFTSEEEAPDSDREATPTEEEGKKQRKLSQEERQRKSNIEPQLRKDPDKGTFVKEGGVTNLKERIKFTDNCNHLNKSKSRMNNASCSKNAPSTISRAAQAPKELRSHVRSQEKPAAMEVEMIESTPQHLITGEPSGRSSANPLSGVLVDDDYAAVLDSFEDNQKLQKENEVLKAQVTELQRSLEASRLTSSQLAKVIRELWVAAKQTDLLAQLKLQELESDLKEASIRNRCQSCGAKIALKSKVRPRRTRILPSMGSLELEFRSSDELSQFVDLYGLRRNSDGLPTLAGDLQKWEMSQVSEEKCSLLQFTSGLAAYLAERKMGTYSLEFDDQVENAIASDLLSSQSEERSRPFAISEAATALEESSVTVDPLVNEGAEHSENREATSSQQLENRPSTAEAIDPRLRSRSKSVSHGREVRDDSRSKGSTEVHNAGSQQTDSASANNSAKGSDNVRSATPLLVPDVDDSFGFDEFDFETDVITKRKNDITLGKPWGIKSSPRRPEAQRRYGTFVSPLDRRNPRKGVERTVPDRSREPKTDSSKRGKRSFADKRSAGDHSRFREPSRRRRSRSPSVARVLQDARESSRAPASSRVARAALRRYDATRRSNRETSVIVDRGRRSRDRSRSRSPRNRRYRRSPIPRHDSRERKFAFGSWHAWHGDDGRRSHSRDGRSGSRGSDRGRSGSRGSQPPRGRERNGRRTKKLRLGSSLAHDISSVRDENEKTGPVRRDRGKPSKEHQRSVATVAASEAEGSMVPLHERRPHKDFDNVQNKTVEEDSSPPASHDSQDSYSMEISAFKKARAKIEIDSVSSAPLSITNVHQAPTRAAEENRVEDVAHHDGQSRTLSESSSGDGRNVAHLEPETHDPSGPLPVSAVVISHESNSGERRNTMHSKSTESSRDATATSVPSDSSCSRQGAAESASVEFAPSAGSAEPGSRKPVASADTGLPGAATTPVQDGTDIQSIPKQKSAGRRRKSLSPTKKSKPASALASPSSPTKPADVISQPPPSANPKAVVPVVPPPGVPDNCPGLLSAADALEAVSVVSLSLRMRGSTIPVQKSGRGPGLTGGGRGGEAVEHRDANSGSQTSQDSSESLELFPCDPVLYPCRKDKNPVSLADGKQAGLTTKAAAKQKQTETKMVKSKRDNRSQSQTGSSERQTCPTGAGDKSKRAKSPSNRTLRKSPRNKRPSTVPSGEEKEAASVPCPKSGKSQKPTARKSPRQVAKIPEVPAAASLPDVGEQPRIPPAAPAACSSKTAALTTVPPTEESSGRAADVRKVEMKANAAVALSKEGNGLAADVRKMEKKWKERKKRKTPVDDAGEGQPQKLARMEAISGADRKLMNREKAKRISAEIERLKGVQEQQRPRCVLLGSVLPLDPSKTCERINVASGNAAVVLGLEPPTPMEALAGKLSGHFTEPTKSSSKAAKERAPEPSGKVAEPDSRSVRTPLVQPPMSLARPETKLRAPAAGSVSAESAQPSISTLVAKRHAKDFFEKQLVSLAVYRKSQPLSTTVGPAMKPVRTSPVKDIVRRVMKNIPEDQGTATSTTSEALLAPATSPAKTPAVNQAQSVLKTPCAESRPMTPSPFAAETPSTGTEYSYRNASMLEDLANDLYMTPDSASWLTPPPPRPISPVQSDLSNAIPAAKKNLFSGDAVDVAMQKSKEAVPPRAATATSDLRGDLSLSPMAVENITTGKSRAGHEKNPGAGEPPVNHTTSAEQISLSNKNANETLTSKKGPDVPVAAKTVSRKSRPSGVSALQADAGKARDEFIPVSAPHPPLAEPVISSLVTSAPPSAALGASRAAPSCPSSIVSGQQAREPPVTACGDCLLPEAPSLPLASDDVNTASGTGTGLIATAAPVRPLDSDSEECSEEEEECFVLDCSNLRRSRGDSESHSSDSRPSSSLSTHDTNLAARDPRRPSGASNDVAKSEQGSSKATSETSMTASGQGEPPGVGAVQIIPPSNKTAGQSSNMDAETEDGMWNLVLF